MATSSCLLTFTSFMIIFLEMGSLKSFGVLFNPMMDSLECSAAELGTVIGMSNSIGYIIGKSLIPILRGKCTGEEAGVEVDLMTSR